MSGGLCHGVAPTPVPCRCPQGQCQVLAFGGRSPSPPSRTRTPAAASPAPSPHPCHNKGKHLWMETAGGSSRQHCCRISPETHRSGSKRRSWSLLSSSVQNRTGLGTKQSGTKEQRHPSATMPGGTQPVPGVVGDMGRSGDPVGQMGAARGRAVSAHPGRTCGVGQGQRTRMSCCCSWGTPNLTPNPFPQKGNRGHPSVPRGAESQNPSFQAGWEEMGTKGH